MTEPFDESTKNFYRALFEGWGLKVESEYEVFARGRTIDLVVESAETNNQIVQESVFAHFRRWNILELKGINDPLTVPDFNRIMMRAWGVEGAEIAEEQAEVEEARNEEAVAKPTTSTREKDLLPSQRAVTIVCVTRPTKILDWLRAEYQFYRTERPGIYLCNERVKQWIIHPSELELIPANYPLLPLARGEKLAQFIEICLRDGLTDYLQLILDVGMTSDPDVIWKKILEAKQMKMTVKEETWPYIDQFLRETPEAIDKLSYFREALAESQRDGQRDGILLTQHRTLVRLLEHKFGTVPPALIKQIEDSNDSAQLDLWLDQILDASSLSALPFHRLTE